MNRNDFGAIGDISYRLNAATSLGSHFFEAISVSQLQSGYGVPKSPEPESPPNQLVTATTLIENILPGFDFYRSSYDDDSLMNASCKALGLDYIPQLRLSFGTEGRPIRLRVNHFSLQFEKCFIYQYRVVIQPDKYPKKINREIVDFLIKCKPYLFNGLRPVYDGRNFLYTKHMWAHGEKVRLTSFHLHLTVDEFYLINDFCQRSSRK